MVKEKQQLVIAAVGDIHVKETSRGEYQAMFAEISQKADLLVLCGDLTDFGLTTEAEILAKELSHCTIPVIGVLGNHDYESDDPGEVKRILQAANVTILQGTEFIFEKNGKQYGFTGVKGFCGGFKPTMWGRFGEPEQKAFYDAVAKEVEFLEIGLNRFRSLPLEKKFVVMHFSPIRETLEGEVVELYPFLGSTRLEEVINRYEVSGVFHGHAHFGTHQGKTATGIPVYNVAKPVMQKINEKQPYALIEI